MAYTLDDFVKLNKNYTKSYDPKTKKATLSNAATGKSINFTSGQGQEYGLGGLSGGSNTIADFDKLTSYLNDGNQSSTARNQSTYSSPYSKDILNTLESIQNSKFSYDPTKDTALQTAQGQAMDAVSRAAARRGMLYSDSNKAQMGEAAANLVPQYEQLAYSRYNDNLNNLLSQLSTYQGLDNTAYNRTQDALNNYASTAGAYGNNYQAEINNIDALMASGQMYDSDGVALADKKRILQSQRQQKIATQEQNAAAAQQQAFENQLKLAETNYAINKPYFKASSGSSSKKEAKPTLTYAQAQKAYENGSRTQKVEDALLYYSGETPNAQYQDLIGKISGMSNKLGQKAWIQYYNENGMITDTEASYLLNQFGII